MLVILKKYKIIVILFLILIAIVGIKVYLNTRTTPPPIISLPQPQISSLPEAPSQIQYSFEKNWPDFPKELPIYKITRQPTVSPSEAKKIASSFGFSAEPKTANDIEAGIFYNWSDGKVYLAIGGKPPTISFGLLTPAPVSTISAGFSQTDAIKLGQKFLREKNLAVSGLDLNHPKIETDPQSTKVSYQYFLSNLPVLNNADLFSVSLVFDNLSNLLKMDYVFLPADLEKEQTISLLSKELVLKNLEEQKGKIISFTDSQNQNLDIPVNYSVFLSQIEKVSLVYYYPTASSNSDLLLPYFLFEGNGIDSRSGKTIKILTLLPATP